MRKKRSPLIVLLVVFAFAPSLAYSALVPQPCLLRVVSIDPWELELWESSETGQFPRLQTKENGLPSVTPALWTNAGRSLVPEDVGQTFRCNLLVPDMAGPFEILSENESMIFRTKWEMPSYWEKQAEETIKYFTSLLIGFFVSLAAVIMWFSFTRKR